MKQAFRNRWPEYLIEAWALGTFMVSACLFTALFEYPGFSWHAALSSALARRGAIGLAMGLTAIFLICSPWGKRSGAHMNPSVTLAFWRLNKISSIDATFYILFQFIGAYLGVVLSQCLLGPILSHPSVGYVVTVPGPGGAAEAWWAEFMISFFLMAVVLVVSQSRDMMSRAGIFAGVLVALYILIEAPISGMSMNPARTLGSAMASGMFDHLVIYFTAPPLAMLAAAEVYIQGERL